jgi:tetratricopeptide (TPR) repeat protein
MQKINEFSDLRKKLDEAITYGGFKLARELIAYGLQKAAELKLPGEIEYFKGQANMLKGDYYQAIRHFDQAIKYNPNDAAAFNDRALCMVESGIIKEAFYYFDKGIEVEPDYATIYHNKGWLLNRVGRHSEAIEYFKKALELEPQRAVTYENLANALVKLSDYQAALLSYQKAINLLKPDYSDIKEQIISQMKTVERKINQIKPTALDSNNGLRRKVE